MTCPHGMTPEQWRVSGKGGCHHCREEIFSSIAQCYAFGHDQQSTKAVGKMHNGRVVAACGRCHQIFVTELGAWIG